MILQVFGNVSTALLSFSRATSRNTVLLFLAQELVPEWPRAQFDRLTRQASRHRSVSAL